MVRIVFIQHDGEMTQVQAIVGQAVMEAAVRNGVSGIDADCGGACSCATCHAYIDSEWSERAGTPSDIERAMLDFAENVTAERRLACQMPSESAVDGMAVKLPVS